MTPHEGLPGDVISIFRLTCEKLLTDRTNLWWDFSRNHPESRTEITTRSLKYHHLLYNLKKAHLEQPSGSLGKKPGNVIDYSLLLYWIFNVNLAGWICPLLSLSSFFSFFSSHLLSPFFTFIVFLLKGIHIGWPELLALCLISSFPPSCPSPSTLFVCFHFSSINSVPSLVWLFYSFPFIPTVTNILPTFPLLLLVSTKRVMSID